MSCPRGMFSGALPTPVASVVKGAGPPTPIAGGVKGAGPPASNWI